MTNKLAANFFAEVKVTPAILQTSYYPSLKQGLGMAQ